MAIKSAWRKPRKVRCSLAAALCTLTLVFCAAVTEVQAQETDSTLALKVKAAFLYNFLKFTTWPSQKLASPTAPLLLCVLKPDPFGPILDDTVSGKMINAHPVTLRSSARPADLRNCNLVYLGDTDSERLDSAMSVLAGNSILIVYEGAAAHAGGGIRFTVVDGKERFEVNLAEIERESLHLSSKLLGLADIVRK